MARAESLIAKALPRLMRARDAELYLGAPHLLKLMQDAGWIKPVVRGNRMTLFDRKHLDECCDRLGGGDFPDSK